MALYKLRTATVTVPTAGTPVQLSATDKLVATLAIDAPSTNNGLMYYGGDDGQSAKIKPEKAVSIELQNDANGKLIEINLKDIYIDADTDGNTVDIIYLERS